MLRCPGQRIARCTAPFLPFSLRGLAAANAKLNCKPQPPEEKKGGAGMGVFLYSSRRGTQAWVTGARTLASAF